MKSNIQIYNELDTDLKEIMFKIRATEDEMNTYEEINKYMIDEALDFMRDNNTDDMGELAESSTSIYYYDLNRNQQHLVEYVNEILSEGFEFDTIDKLQQMAEYSFYLEYYGEVARLSGYNQK